MNFSFFTVFLKNKNIIFKIRRSQVTDYAALSEATFILSTTQIWQSYTGPTL